MSPAQAWAALHEAGFDFRADEITPEAREDRWLARLPGDRMAWFPANEEGRARLAADRRLLRLLAVRCRFQVPRILYESEAGFDLRAAVPGFCDPIALYARIAADRALAGRLGHALGLILAEQHGRVARSDVAGWLREHVPWPEPLDWIRERLPDVTDDAPLLARIDRVLEIQESLVVPDNDRALVHGDLGVHNIAIDPTTGDLQGVFDYDGAAWDDRHLDFRYLVFDHQARICCRPRSQHTNRRPASRSTAGVSGCTTPSVRSAIWPTAAGSPPICGTADGRWRRIWPGSGRPSILRSDPGRTTYREDLRP